MELPPQPSTTSARGSCGCPHEVEAAAKKQSGQVAHGFGQREGLPIPGDDRRRHRASTSSLSELRVSR